MSLVIRPAAAADETAVTALWHACALVVSYNDPASDFRFALGRTNSDVLVGVASDGRIIASVLVGHDGHRGWLYYVAVDPSRRREGHGKSMVRAAEDWLSRRGIRKAQLLIRETNSEVAAFYSRIGFEAAPRIVMQKWLATKP